MKWSTAERKEKKYLKQLAEQQWHPYFALIPRLVAENEWRWLETLERRKVWYEGYILVPDMKPYKGWKSRWEYRALQSSEIHVPN